MSSERAHIRHLLFRAGFGPAWEDADALERMSLRDVQRRLFRDSEAPDPLPAPGGLGLPASLLAMTPEERQEAVRTQRLLIRGLNAAWLERMAASQGQLREKMTLFWHSHFACRLRHPALVLRQHNTLRQHALGSFADLLRAISKDPGMLQFLNSQQNTREQPNENFAREVMELFTLGRGHYTESDIREAARAFTGWGFDAQGEFVFRPRRHDYGEKTFRGRTGPFDGDDILDMLLEDPQTARFITRKLYRYFVHPEPAEAVVEEWAGQFYRSGYQIGELMETIFTSAHFYEARNLGARIKSPVEYLAGLMRLLNLRFGDAGSAFFVQRAMGQVLFDPPGVAGWPDGRAWIDGSALMLRLRLPLAMAYAAELDFQPKAEFAGDEDLSEAASREARRLNVRLDWTPILRQLGSVSPQRQLETAAAFCLQTPLPASVPSLLQIADPEQRYVRLLCTPEFQLC
ncbi:MAG: DUF1800 domain-containing protein [Bacteroidia bacterium]|nr:DUF1800 domain-containing protein [Bacteroidia bacterium]